jgi:FAD/FMN-containing dehydrogenase
MFVNWFGSTGIVIRLALALWPLRRHRRRDAIACRDVESAVAFLRAGAPMGLFDDLAGLTWPAAKWALGLDRLGPRDPNEPEIYIVADYGADTEREIATKARRLAEIAPVEPIPVDDMVALAPDLRGLAELPARFGFLLDHEGGGLTWVGTYGPMDQLEGGARGGIALMERHGHPPLAVCRPMNGGHFAVLRFIERFDRRSPEATANVRALNVALGRMLMDKGYVPYKCPATLYDDVFARLDPGFVDLMRRLKRAVDPNGILNPDRWRLGL